MHRTILFKLVILLFCISSLSAEDVSSYSIRKEQRKFESLGTAASYLMKDTTITHPGIKYREKIFFPPLEDCNLYLILPTLEKAKLTITMNQGTADLTLPISQEPQILTLIIPKGISVSSLNMPLAQEYSLSPYQLLESETEIKVQLDSPDEYLLNLPTVNPEGKELRLNLDNRDILNIQNKYGEMYRLEAYEGSRSFHFPFPEDNSATLTLSSPSGLNALSFQAVDVPIFPNSLVRSGIQILNRPLSTWRNEDFEVYSWSSFPEIMILDCLDYDVQNRFFRRLAFFVEKKGYKGKLLSNAELQGKHAWNAHDYRPYDLAEFYNLVAKRNISIYPEEVLLRNLLISNGILVQDEDGTLYAGQGAVLSISRESSDALRYRFFVHESSHGIYFTSFEYREFVRTLWESLHEEDRDMWRFFLGWYGYDSDEEDLMINEFQAYLMQQSADEAPGYFGPRMSSLAGKYPSQRKLLERGTGADSAGFQVWAEVLEDWLLANWGMKAGNFFPLHKE